MLSDDVFLKEFGRSIAFFVECGGDDEFFPQMSDADSTLSIYFLYSFEKKRWKKPEVV